MGVAGLLAFGISHLMLWSEYRCPACEQSVQDGETWPFNPRSCPGCGVGLRRTGAEGGGD